MRTIVFLTQEEAERRARKPIPFVHAIRPPIVDALAKSGRLSRHFIWGFSEILKPASPPWQKSAYALETHPYASEHGYSCHLLRTSTIDELADAAALLGMLDPEARLETPQTPLEIEVSSVLAARVPGFGDWLYEAGISRDEERLFIRRYHDRFLSCRFERIDRPYYSMTDRASVFVQRMLLDPVLQRCATWQKPYGYFCWKDGYGTASCWEDSYATEPAYDTLPIRRKPFDMRAFVREWFD